LRTGVPYLPQRCGQRTFLDNYPEVAVALYQAVYEAGDWIREDPVKAIDMMEKVDIEEALHLLLERRCLTLDQP
jgi:ABC-type nitrate/sulfonate/bicarbonate transport system substrate-binding protein